MRIEEKRQFAAKHRDSGGVYGNCRSKHCALGTATTSVSDFVAGAVSILQTSGLRFELTAMGTMIEGDLVNGYGNNTKNA